MPNQKIQNQSISIPQTPQMNERDFLNDILTTEKYFGNSYSIAITELSHQVLYQDILNLANESRNMQRELYNLMFQKGWYGLEVAPQETLTQSYQQFSGYKPQLPYGTGNQHIQ